MNPSWGGRERSGCQEDGGDEGRGIGKREELIRGTKRFLGFVDAWDSVMGDKESLSVTIIKV